MRQRNYQLSETFRARQDSYLPSPQVYTVPVEVSAVNVVWFASSCRRRSNCRSVEPWLDLKAEIDGYCIRVPSLHSVGVL